MEQHISITHLPAAAARSVMHLQLRASQTESILQLSMIISVAIVSKSNLNLNLNCHKVKCESETLRAMIINQLINQKNIFSSLRGVLAAQKE